MAMLNNQRVNQITVVAIYGNMDPINIPEMLAYIYTIHGSVMGYIIRDILVVFHHPMCWFLWDPTWWPDPGRKRIARYIHREASVLREKEMHLGWISELANWRNFPRFFGSCGEASNDAQFWPVHFPQTVCILKLIDRYSWLKSSYWSVVFHGPSMFLYFLRGCR